MIGCLTETTTCVVAKPLIYIKLKFEILQSVGQSVNLFIYFSD